MISVQDLLLEKKIHFRPVGNGNFLVSCLSPTHDDKNPSMRINGATGAAVCFSCGYSLNLYTHYGILDNKVNAKAHKVLMGIDRLRNREIVIPKGSTPITKSFRGISLETLTKFKAFTNPIMFIDSVCFPLYNAAGKLKAFIARDKESNNEKYKIFPPGAVLPYFPPKPKPANGTVILVEGVIDVLNPFDKGLTCCVASLGINMNRQQLTELVAGLKLNGATRIILAYDNDRAGQDACKRLLPKLEKHFPIVEIFDWMDSVGNSIDIKDFGEADKETISVISEKIFGFDIT